MYYDLHPSDADLIPRLVVFNNVYVSRYLRIFSEKVFRELYPGELSVRPVFFKGDLKDMIVANSPCHNSRTEELIRNYYSDPGRFYRETPFHATLFFSRQGAIEEYIGSYRIKRVRRLAEKSARKIIDRMFYAIKKRAEALADDRAMRLGIPRHQLVTPHDEMNEEFLKAENRLLEDLRHKREILDAEDMIINDVAGMKVILEDSEQRRLLALLQNMKDCEIVEKEQHEGRYNATNLIVCFKPSREEIIVQPLKEKIVNIMQLRGLDPEEANRSFAEFVRSGEERVYLEIIVCNYQEMLESEIGRCMHEDRIIEQRLRQQYRGHLAKNIEYLMEYLFTYPSSTQLELGELPIKLWNRYLPDYFEEVLRTLFKIPQGSALE